MGLTAEERFNKAAEELETVQKDVKALLRSQEDELSRQGETSKKTAKSFEDVNKRTDDAIAEIKSLEKRIEELTVALARPSGSGAESKSEANLFDIGARVVESKTFKTWQERGFDAKGINIELPNFSQVMNAMTGGFGGMGHPLIQKALTSLAASGGDAIDPRRLPGFVANPLAPRRLRNIIPVIPTSGPVEYVKETNFHQLHTLVDGTSNSGQAVVQVANINGFYPGQTITIAPGTGSEETKVVLSVTTATMADASGDITLTTNLANTHAAGVEVVSDTFVFTPETTLKPNAEITVDLITDTPKVLAHMLSASRQILDDAPQFRGFINTRLLDSFVLSEERQILYGTNTGNQIRGILNETDINAYSWSSGTPGDTKLDAIRRAMTLSALAFYPVTGIVVHPSDWEDMQLAKGEDGHYIWATVPGGTDNMVWRAPVVDTTAINVGTSLVGAFSLGAAIYDREMANVRVSEEHSDYFSRNMVAIRAEERIATAVYRPPSFTGVTFDSAPV